MEAAGKADDTYAARRAGYNARRPAQRRAAAALVPLGDGEATTRARAGVSARVGAGRDAAGGAEAVCLHEASATLPGTRRRQGRPQRPPARSVVPWRSKRGHCTALAREHVEINPGIA